MGVGGEFFGLVGISDGEWGSVRMGAWLSKACYHPVMVKGVVESIVQI